VLVWDAAGAVRWPSPRNMNLRDRADNHYHAKAAILDEAGVAGFRLVSHPGEDEQARSSTRFIILVEAETSLPLAIVDESWSYAQRTVASVVMASRHLANEGPTTLALVGAGRLATTALEYFSRLFHLHEVRIASRRPETRGALAARASEKYGIQARPADTIEQAVRGATVVLTCTSSGHAVLEEPWIGPGTVVAALETSEPGREYAEQAHLFVVDSREQLEKELIEEFGEQAPGWVDATVGEVITGKHPGRTNADQRVLIVTEGMASQDIALAHLAYRRAVDRGAGAALTMASAEEG
jgi:ornithine cyclodeaminase/alanine dehydrogenase-like protein (mu-crystallin family)